MDSPNHPQIKPFYVQSTKARGKIKIINCLILRSVAKGHGRSDDKYENKVERCNHG